MTVIWSYYTGLSTPEMEERVATYVAAAEDCSRPGRKSPSPGGCGRCQPPTGLIEINLIVQPPSNCGHTPSSVFLDPGLVPCGDKLAGRLDQSFDDLECATPYRDRGPMRSQFTPCEIDLPRSKLVYRPSPSAGILPDSYLQCGLRSSLQADTPRCSRS